MISNDIPDCNEILLNLEWTSQKGDIQINNHIQLDS